MRIQHNIMAMNAYRNYTNNTKALSKNLEKLSSGYKINRAGDDAAGLAISEKMRAQITGLKTAQKNAKDGISLVQTAEGALTEVHSMLNRMVELADQSANGTYDDAVDRANLQKEFDALRTEIDRIADSANFNGIKLLDGSLSTTGKTSSAATGVELDLASILKAGGVINDVPAIKGVYKNKTAVVDIASGAATGDNDGQKISYTFEYLDKDGNSQSKTVEFTFKTSGDDDTGGKLVAADGTEYAAAADATGVKDKVAKGNIESAVVAELLKDDGIKSSFDVKADSDLFVFTAKDAGTSGAQLTGVKASTTTAAGVETVKAEAAENTTKAVDAYQALKMDGMTTFDGTNLDKAVFSINGEKFAFVAHGANTAENLAKLAEAGVSHFVTLAAAGGPATADVSAMAEKITFATGLKTTKGTFTAAAGGNPASFAAAAAGVSLAIQPSTITSTKANGGLTLQIGDTSESFNQLTVSVADMHAKALGISGISIADQANAQSAVETLKEAINSVSSTRGGLGALQNRLEHTINNLSVMQENIQDAEATIRDVDVAEEMMAYTKNTILVQSAQAMLAQANQVPQGVLQLLQ